MDLRLLREQKQVRFFNTTAVPRLSSDSLQGPRCPMRLFLKCIFLLVLSCNYVCGIPLFAQGPPALASGPPDAPYAQSKLLRSIDQEWFLPSAVLPTEPLSDAPIATSRPKPDPLDKSGKESSSSSMIIRTQDSKTRAESDTRFRWLPAIAESLLYTGIMHTFDIALQPGTRDALNGHWFAHYTESVSELRGWSDSDNFYGSLHRASNRRLNFWIHRAAK